jgi:hypothetical protein
VLVLKSKQACRDLQKIGRTDQAEAAAAVIGIADKRIVIWSFQDLTAIISTFHCVPDSDLASQNSVQPTR